MVLCDDNCLRQVLRYIGVQDQNIYTDDASKVPVISGFGNHKSVKGFGTIIIACARDSKCPLLGKSVEDEAFVRQWIEYATCYANYCDSTQTAHRVLKELNSILVSRAYLVGNKLSLADVVLYYVLYTAVTGLSYQDKERYLHVSRWFDNLQQDSSLRRDNNIIHFSRIPIYA
ncbi:eukaryotic translation elongation factor 1 epsilon-1 [Bacillus rossius redtenbacheri]|uniref:eukaryotic translation elongation factor 1 epsilon-1 n=1 Tax=Bacillus rossius redtenbacheri TaxID=93214 RepID=UPI002FDDACF1